jgi:hypothetical protein
MKEKKLVFDTEHTSQKECVDHVLAL